MKKEIFYGQQNDFAGAFERKIDKDYHIRLQFNVYETENDLYSNARINAEETMEHDIWQIEVNNGNGIMAIGDEEYKIETKNYYHMNPKDKVYIKNREEEILEILYLSNTW